MVPVQDSLQHCCRASSKICEGHWFPVASLARAMQQARGCYLMPVQLRPHVATLVRRCCPNLLRGMLVGHPRGWPLHLQLAWTILRESGLSAQGARILVHNAATAGYECARRMNERSQA